MLHYGRLARLRSRTDLSLTPQPDPPSASHSTLHPHTWTCLLTTLQHQHTIQHSTLLSTLQYKPGNPAFAILFIHITDRYLYILQEKFTMLSTLQYMPAIQPFFPFYFTSIVNSWLLSTLQYQHTVQPFLPLYSASTYMNLPALHSAIQACYTAFFHSTLQTFFLYLPTHYCAI